MKEFKHIYWFSYYNEDSPSVRYRGKYILDYFEDKYDGKYSFVTPGYHPKKLLRFARTYSSALFARKKDSIIVIQRVQSKFIYALLLQFLVRVRQKNTVYDLDDADYLEVDPEPIYTFAKRCSLLSVGSHEIKNHLNRFNSNISITPSPTPNLGVKKEAKNDLFTIGWIGSFGGDHKRSMIELVFPAVKALNIRCRFEVFGALKEEDVHFIQNYFQENENIEVVAPLDINWRDEASIQNRISTFDIGIATLTDNEMQRSKSGIKAKQYLNNGVPVLGTNLPENDWVIEDGKNGFFCANSSDFLKHLEYFAELSADDYQTFIQNALDTANKFRSEAYLTPLFNGLQKKSASN